MTISIFLTFSGNEADASALESDFISSGLPALQGEPGVRFVETYTPAKGDVPQFDEGPRPPLLVELNLDEAEDAQHLLGTPALPAALRCQAADSGPATVDVFHAVHFPLPESVEPPPREASLSFVVRYYRPAPDEAAFVAFYTAHHPLLLGRLPGIRNVLCYLPTGIPLPDGLQPSGAFFGNEVVFNDLDSLNQALASEVLDELRAEGKQFPAYGHSTHQAMRRQLVYSRPATAAASP